MKMIITFLTVIISSPTFAEPLEGTSPLTKAALTGSYRELELFLREENGDANAFDSKGDLGLTVALTRDPYMMETEYSLRVLLDNGADPNLLDKKGNSPLMIAAKRPNSYVFNYLIRAGAKINLRGANGRTALMEAASAGENLGCKIGKTNNVKILLKNGADKTLKDDEGFTAYQLNEKSACPSLEVSQLLK